MAENAKTEAKTKLKIQDVATAQVVKDVLDKNPATAQILKRMANTHRGIQETRRIGKCVARALEIARDLAPGTELRTAIERELGGIGPKVDELVPQLKAAAENEIALQGGAGDSSQPRWDAVSKILEQLTEELPNTSN